MRPEAVGTFTLNPHRWSHATFTGVILAVFWGVLFRLAAGLEQHAGPFKAAGAQNASRMMTLAFIVLGPLTIGFISAYVPGRRQHLPISKAILLPWSPLFITCAVAALFAWEGSICVVLLLPIGMLFSSIGGLLALAVTRLLRARPAVVSCAAMLPFILIFAEARMQRPVEMRTVENTIRIHADAATVWQNIQSVPPISANELRPTWTHRIGFPRPVAAVLSRPGIGGVRTASFEHGLVFYETVNDWQPLHQLGFTIKADTEHIPPTTLDEHVKIGGPYFDVLDGQYRIEQDNDGTILLRLTSQQRLSTDFNGYAALWSDAVMGSLQSSILEVIQHPCEATSHANASLSAPNHP